MKPRVPLPAHLHNTPFTVRAGVDAGLGEHRLRGSDLQKPYRGIRIATTNQLTLIDLARAYQERMPTHAFFAMVTAAVIMGVPLPYRHENSRQLHVAVPDPCRPPRGLGIVGHRLQMPATCNWDGLRLCSPEQAWCDLASILSLPDLVAAGDHLIRRRLPLTTPAKLATAAEQYPGRRGVRKLRVALPLLSDRAESRPESHLRVIVLQAGLPGLAVNFPIRTSGGFHYRADLAFPTRKVLLEYQGDYHREPEQFRADMTRISRLEADGWFVMQVNADDMRNAEELVQRIRRVLIERPQFG